MHFLRAGALEREAREETELRLVDLLDAVDEFREIVFEELFALRGEGGDVFLLISLGDDEAEEELFAALLGHLRSETGGGGPLLVRGIGARRDDVEGELAASGADVLAEHLLYAGGVVFVLDGEAGGVLGEVEVDDDGLLDLAEHGLGAGGEGVDGVGGQIETRGERRREVVDEHEADKEEDDGEGFGAEFHR